jgi:hypothetical protein
MPSACQLGYGQWNLAYEACLDVYALACEQDPNDCFVTLTESHNVIINNRSDGFICEDSQIGPIAFHSYEAEDANHLQETQTSSTVRDRMDDCFNRNDNFRTNPR